MVVSVPSLPVKEIFPGFRARIVHTMRTSLSWVEIDAGARFPRHTHPHEQVVNVLDGELELIVDDTPHRLTSGMCYVIPPDVPHEGRAITPCRVLDVFAPTREEYR